MKSNHGRIKSQTELKLSRLNRQYPDHHAYFWGHIYWLYMYSMIVQTVTEIQENNVFRHRAPKQGTEKDGKEM